LQVLSSESTTYVISKALADYAKAYCSRKGRRDTFMMSERNQMITTNSILIEKSLTSKQQLRNSNVINQFFEHYVDFENIILSMHLVSL